jgi:hypothetical protein
MDAKIIAQDFFIYSTLFTSLAPGVAQSNTINIQADSDFVINEMTYGANILVGGVVTTTPNYTTRIFPNISIVLLDAGSGRQLMDSAIDLSALAGSGERPFFLPIKKRLAARSNLVITAQNFNTVDTYRLNLSFVGFKRFYGN